MASAVLTSGAPRPAGNYSQAIVHNGFAFVSGQLPIDPAKGPRAESDPLMTIEEQVDRTLRNVEAIVLAAGSSMDRIVRCTVYVSDVALWPRVNAAYGAYFAGKTSTLPARTVVPCGPLHFGYSVEIDAIAAVQ